jgi:hypothetical protein
MKYIEQIETELPKDDGFIYVEVKGCIDYSIDRKFGSDADGNRGVKSTIINDVTGIQAIDSDANVLTLTQKEEDYLSDKLVRRFLGE